MSTESRENSGGWIGKFSEKKKREKKEKKLEEERDNGVSYRIRHREETSRTFNGKECS